MNDELPGVRDLNGFEPPISIRVKDSPETYREKFPPIVFLPLSTLRFHKSRIPNSQKERKNLPASNAFRFSSRLYLMFFSLFAKLLYRYLDIAILYLTNRQFKRFFGRCHRLLGRIGQHRKRCLLRGVPVVYLILK